MSSPTLAAPKAQRAAPVAAGHTAHSAAAFDGAASVNGVQNGGVQNGSAVGSAAAAAAAQPRPGRLFTFGICTDVQYADLPQVRCEVPDIQNRIAPAVDSLSSCPSCLRHGRASRTAAQRGTTGTAWKACGVQCGAGRTGASTSACTSAISSMGAFSLGAKVQHRNLQPVWSQLLVSAQSIRESHSRASLQCAGHNMVAGKTRRTGGRRRWLTCLVLLISSASRCIT